MKKSIFIFTAFVMLASLVSCSKKQVKNSGGDASAVSSQSETGSPVKTAFKVAMITDSGDITDESFNQTTYEAGKKFCDANGLSYKYYKPQGDNDADRVAAAEQAIAEGANIILCPGYLMAAMIVECAEIYPDVKFIALDVADGDILAAAVPNYDYDPSKYNVKDHYHSENVFCAVYQEEIPGYMAGYAAVKFGYRHLGFLGGMAVPAVIRYGYGYVQGINDAAKELGVENDVIVEYVYGNQFYGDTDIRAYMDTWVSNKTEVIFACGGGIYTSAAEAAQKVPGTKIIGVDVDQKPTIDGQYGEDMTITSAMKGLAATVDKLLTEIVLNDNWGAYSGKIERLGLVSEDLVGNYVELAPSTKWTSDFSPNDYKNLVKNILNKTIVVSDAVDKEPSVSVKVNYYGNIK